VPGKYIKIKEEEDDDSDGELSDDE